MSDDIHDDLINLDDPSEYEDPVSQRAMAFCHVAKLADTARCKLEQTVVPVETIAEQCGFGNAERMRRTFQRLFDISPQDYRARFRSALLT